MTRSLIPQSSVLHLETNSLWRSAVTAALRHERYRLLNCECTNGLDGLACVREYRPDIVLAGVNLADSDANTLFRELMVLSSRPCVVVTTSRTDEFELYHIKRYPVQAIVCKESGFPNEWLEALDAARNGRRYLAAQIQARVQAMHASPTSFFKILSDRELELLPVLGYGLSDEAVAEYGGSNAATVKSHRRHIMSKLGLHRTEDLMRWAVQKGFCDLSRPAPPCELMR